jgi:polar amino acid transport system substrate-binding protein
VSSWRARASSGTALLLAVLLSTGCDDGAGSRDADPVTTPEVVESGALVVCTELPYAPFVQQEEDEEPSGFEIELLEQVAAGLDLDLEVRRTAYADIDDGRALADDLCDVAAGALAVTEDREARMRFTEPHYDEKVTLLVPTASDIGDLDGVAGRRLAVQRGTPSEAYAQDNAPPGTEIVDMPGDQHMVTALRQGRVDAVLQDLPVNLVHVQDGAFEVVDERSTGEQYAFAVGRDADELLRDLDQGLAELRSDGTIDALHDDYFPTE